MWINSADSGVTVWMCRVTAKSQPTGKGQKMKDLKVILAVTLMLLCALGCAACGMSRRGADDTTTVETTTASPETTPETTTESVPVAVGDVYSHGLSYKSNGDGSCTLTGIGNCRDSCLIIPEVNESGETVTAISSGAFAGNTTVSAVQIPDSVTEIGDGAFAACPALAYISVDAENTAYCEMGGVLYTADHTQLICIPAGSSMTTLNVTLQLRKIAPRASEGCGSLGKIMFEGNESQWKCIVIGEGNAPIAAINPVCLRQSGK